MNNSNPVAPAGAHDELQPTPLAQSLPGLPLEAHGGALTPGVMSTVAEEVEAFLTSAAIFDLGWRAKIRISGEDRLRWLNGMVTNTVQALPENEGNYNFALNAQGRIQADCYIYRRAEDLLLDTGRDQAASLLRHLDHFIIMDEVELQEVSEQWTALALAGPKAPQILSSLGIDMPANAEGNARFITARISTRSGSGNSTDEGLNVIAVDAYHVLVPRYELWFAPTAVTAVWEALRGAGATAAGLQAAEALRVLEGTPLFGRDLGDRDLPQETRQTRALNFNKGCYLGQEIVERIRSRGKVHRSFRQFSLEGADTSLPFDLENDGQAAGRITSTASFSNHILSGKFALGFIREEIVERKDSIHYEGGAAIPLNGPPSLQNQMAGEPKVTVGESNA